MGVAQNEGWTEGYRDGYRRGRRTRILNQAAPGHLLTDQTEHAAGFRAGYFAEVRDRLNDPKVACDGIEGRGQRVLQHRQGDIRRNRMND